MVYYILLDVGGTGIRCSAVDSDGTVLIEARKYSSEADGSSFAIIDRFCSIILGIVREVGEIPAAIHMAFPGPFDYEKGISYMRGIGKYDAIYGLSLPDESRKESCGILRNVPMKFIHDVEAYAIGAYVYDIHKTLHHVMAITIGTGCGSAFLVDGKAVKGGTEIPENGWIYSYPFKDGIIDDYISARGQKQLSEKYFGEVIDGRELDRLASAGESRAIDMFSEFGEELLEALQPFADRFMPDAIILGGSISGSARFFTDRLINYCRSIACQLIVDSETSQRAMDGLLIAAGGLYGIG